MVGNYSYRLNWQINWLVLVNAILFALSLTAGADDKFTARQLDFFEDKIRPLLVNHCLECHGADKSESDLRLDSRLAVLKGGESGDAAAIAGKPENSLLIRSVKHVGDYDMPPSSRLSDDEIADLANWISMGLPWPKSRASISKRTMAELLQQHRKDHWSFQPVSPPVIPQVGLISNSPLDQLILAKLQTKQLTPSPRASRRTLIRRAYFDLIGLPPTYEEVQAFIHNESPDAYKKLIDQLLDSPHYGERWARHWLDVARYSDTSGYKLADADRNYPYAYTYRDYVIDAFNQDLPYDQFIREQLAADHLEIPEDKKTLAALGFITVGRIYLGRPETIDDQVDVVTRGLMGLTVGCARCHDHKYDAIPTEDYYSLYSVFENNVVPSELPLIGAPSELHKFKAHLAELGELKNKLKSYRKQCYADFRKHIETYTVEYVTRCILSGQEDQIQKQPFINLTKPQLRSALIEKWRVYLAKRSKISQPILLPAVEFLKLPDENFASRANRMIKTWDDTQQPELNPLVLQALKDHPPKNKFEIGKIYGELFEGVIDTWKSNGAKPSPIGQFKGPEKELAEFVFNKRAPFALSERHLDNHMTPQERRRAKQLGRVVADYEAKAPENISRAMVLRDKETLKDERVMIRGNAHQRGKVAPRRFVALLSPNKRALFENKSGRLDLAEKIATPENPLTARVMVNRVWMHHFSTPLVDTPSDFGIRCDKPLQQKVLDYLAYDFMKHGWSLKRLHRQIMLSNTYCQSSLPRDECASVDPENRLYWKMNRRRLEFEPLRDSILAVTRSLDKKMHGKSINLLEEPYSHRRTIYGFIDRQDLPGLFRVFDLANPDQSTAKRIRTTVPQQSLFMMNSEMVMEQAEQLILSIPNFKESSRTDRIVSLYRAALQRDPSELEIKIGSLFIQNAFAEIANQITAEAEVTATETRDPNASLQLNPWHRLAQTLLCTNEFEFID